MNLFNINVTILSSVVIALFMNGHILCDHGDEIPEEYKGLAKTALDKYNRDCGTLKKKCTRCARLLGGWRAEEHSHPWMAYLRVAIADDSSEEEEFESFNCAGTLIGPHHILTAAHCFIKDSSQATRPDYVFVYLGHSDTEILQHNEEGKYEKKVLEIKIHENFEIVTNEEYDILKLKNDIAIVVLEDEVVLDDHVRPICLPPKSNRDFKEYDHKAIMTGWGNMEPEMNRNDNGKFEQAKPEKCVQHLRVFNQSRILTNEECNTKFREKVTDESMICVGMGDHSFCEGDSGGPVIVREPNEKFYQIAILSNGYDCEPENNDPSYCTRITYFRDWIDKVVIDTYEKILSK